MQYEFKSLEEMARFFDSQAEGCKAAATREKSITNLHKWNREAYAWSQAANVVRNSAIVGESDIAKYDAMMAAKPINMSDGGSSQ